MSEQNKKIVRDCWLGCFNEGNLALVDTMVSPDVVWHGPNMEVKGREGMKQLITMIRTAFPDVRMTFEDQIAQGEKVASRWTMRGTHQGDLMGIPPTHKPATFTGIVISRLEGGEIAEEWEDFDQLGMMQQLGVIPRPGA